MWGHARLYPIPDQQCPLRFGGVIAAVLQISPLGSRKLFYSILFSSCLLHPTSASLRPDIYSFPPLHTSKTISHPTASLPLQCLLQELCIELIYFIDSFCASPPARLPFCSKANSKKAALSPPVSRDQTEFVYLSPLLRNFLSRPPHSLKVYLFAGVIEKT